MAAGGDSGNNAPFAGAGGKGVGAGAGGGEAVVIAGGGA